jgi:hypothetical protein
MMDKSLLGHVSSKRTEEAAKSHDILQRARAASPVSGGAGVDRLNTPGKTGNVL